MGLHSSLRLRNIALAAVFAAVLTNAFAPALAGDQQDIKAVEKAEVVALVADLLTERYVFSETGHAMADHLRQLHAQGVYAALDYPGKFCRQVTADLREISRDKHLFVFNSPLEAREVAAEKGLLSPDEAAAVAGEIALAERRANHGVTAAAVLEGNVGYLELTYMSDGSEANRVAAAAMEMLAGTEAMIIDLRENGGGGGSVQRMLASYFFAGGGFPLTGVQYRGSDALVPVLTLAEVPGLRRPEIPLFMLTSVRTFSAAEDFCYSLQVLGRARVVGENSKGGAHPVDVVIIKGDILVQVPIGTSVNPVSGSNWEKVGVTPDIPVPAEDALTVAHVEALIELRDASPEVERKAELLELIQEKRP
jgi:hypothetical protein